MKMCRKCGTKLQDNVQMCNICGGTDFLYQRVNSQQRQTNNQQGMNNQQRITNSTPQRTNTQRPVNQQQRINTQGNNQQRMNNQQNQQRINNQQRVNTPNNYNTGNDLQNPYRNYNNLQSPVRNETENGILVDDFGNEINFDTDLDIGDKTKKNRKEKIKEPKVVDPRDITVGGWLILWLKLMIPIFNIVVIFKTLLKDDNNTRKNFIIAYLIMLAISIVISIACSYAISAVLLSSI